MATSRKYPKWTKARRAKFMATVKAKHGKKFYRRGASIPETEAPARRGQTTRDAIVFLKQAEASIMERIRAGTIRRPDNAHLLAMQALNILQGDK